MTSLRALGFKVDRTQFAKPIIKGVAKHEVISLYLQRKVSNDSS